MSAQQPSAAVKALVRTRAQDRCEMCGGSPEGGSYHHRRVKGMGGDKRPDTNHPANLLLLCGSGVTGCHGWVHHDSTGLARDQGLLLSKFSTPALEPVVTYLRGRVLLDDLGGWEQVA